MYEFPDNVFAEFALSSSYKQVVENFDRNYQSIEEAIQCIKEEIVSVGANLEILAWLKSSDITANDIREKLLEKLKLCKDLMYYPTDNKEWLLIISWVKICIDSSKNLPFYIDFPKNEIKFDWSEFYRRIQTRQSAHNIISQI